MVGAVGLGHQVSASRGSSPRRRQPVPSSQVPGRATGGGRRRCQLATRLASKIALWTLPPCGRPPCPRPRPVGARPQGLNCRARPPRAGGRGNSQRPQRSRPPPMQSHPEPEPRAGWAPPFAAAVHPSRPARPVPPAAPLNRPRGAAGGTATGTLAHSPEGGGALQARVTARSAGVSAAHLHGRRGGPVRAPAGRRAGGGPADHAPTRGWARRAAGYRDTLLVSRPRSSHHYLAPSLAATVLVAKRAMLARMSSADLVQTKGFGSSLWAARNSWMAVTSEPTLVCAPRLI